jgi:curli production assembly/transport component CsgF
MHRYRIAVVFLAFAAATAGATELVYTPVNPNFGGNPLNGPTLLSNAQAQNQYEEDPDAPVDPNKNKTPLDQFNEQLQRAILNRIAQALSGNVVDANGNLIPGTVSTSDFTINIVDNGDGTVTITTTDKATGQSTSFVVSASL